MSPNIRSITNPAVRQFYALYWPHHQIILDFYERLAEEQYDVRIVETPQRKADSPRESLAHILYVQLVYLTGIKTGKLEFRSLGVEHYPTLSKQQLLAEMERIDSELFGYLTSETFSNGPVEVFWGGQMKALDVLYFLRDHDILHAGWNLAVMDYVNMPRFESLVQYWG